MVISKAGHTQFIPIIQSQHDLLPMYEKNSSTMDYLINSLKLYPLNINLLKNRFCRVFQDMHCLAPKIIGPGMGKICSYRGYPNSGLKDGALERSLA